MQDLILEEPEIFYKAKDLLYKEEVFELIGVCIDVHKELGKGFSEIVYKDAMEVDLRKKNIDYERERKFEIEYKGQKLPHYYFADFVYDNKIIVEVKAQNGLVEEHYKQVLNYLAVSKLRLGIIVNFNDDIIKFKRVIL